MTEPAPLRVLIADDELLARQRLEDLLRHEPRVEVVATAPDGHAAVEAIRAHRPDLVFLDVQMPGLTGPEVVRAIGADSMPATIFVTAYDNYAVQAFELAAVDYLVKPFDDERFEHAFRRARRSVELAEVDRLRDRLLAVLQGSGAASATRSDTAASAAPTPAAPDYLERIAVEMRGQVRVVPVEQVLFVTASGPYAEIHTAERTFIIRERMQELEERLDPARFIRVHRSAIVRLDLIEAIVRGVGGDYAVKLKGGARVKVSRSRIEELERRMGVA